MYIKTTAGSITTYWVAEKLTRFEVGANGMMKIYMEGTTTYAQYAVTDWNNGRLVDAAWTDTGMNPMQV